MTADPQDTNANNDAKHRIAIVDDESGVRQTLVRGLERFGYVCRPFRSGVDFLDSLEFEIPDCVVLDMRMPELDGLGVLGKIPKRKQYPSSCLPRMAK